MSESRGPVASVPTRGVPGGAAGAEARTLGEAVAAWGPSLPTPSAQVAVADLTSVLGGEVFHLLIVT